MQQDKDRLEWKLPDFPTEPVTYCPADALLDSWTWRDTLRRILAWIILAALSAAAWCGLVYSAAVFAKAGANVG